MKTATGARSGYSARPCWMLALIGALATACASTRPASQATEASEATPGPRLAVLYDNKKPQPIAVVDRVYVRAMLVTREMMTRSGGQEDDFAAEVITFGSVVASSWQEAVKADSSLRDPGYDGLAAAVDAGFVDEYVLANYDNPLWTVPLLPKAKSRSFDVAGYFAWAREHLQGAVAPMLPVIVREGSPRTVENASRRMIRRHPKADEVKKAYDAVLAGGDCAPHRELVETVARGWPREKEEVRQAKQSIRSGDGTTVAVVPERRGRVVSFASVQEYVEYVTSISVEQPPEPIPVLASMTFAQANAVALLCANREQRPSTPWFDFAADMDPRYAQMMNAFRSSLTGNTPSPCPSPDSDPEARCPREVGAEYGYRPESPLELGLAAGGDLLWFGRLLCENGARPSVRRVGAVGRPVTPSGAAPSPALAALPGTAELLDRWEVRCPGDATPRTLYSNLYRCGLACPPRPFRVLPAATSHLLEQCDARAKDKPADALPLLDQVPDSDRNLAPVLDRTAWLLVAAQRYADAEAAFRRLLTMDPNDVAARMGVAMARKWLGDDASYASEVLALRAVVSPGDEWYTDVQCAAGRVLQSQGQPVEASEAMEAACSEREAGCCDPTNSP